MEIRIDARRLTGLLLAIVALLACAHVMAMVLRFVLGYNYAFGLIDTFNLNFENNVPTFFSAFLLVFAAVLLAVQAGIESGLRSAVYWRWLAVIFAFLAVDEDASLHELLIDPLRTALSLGGPLQFAWTIPYGVLLIVLASIFLRFLWTLPPRTRRLFFLAGALYVGGAMGCELAAGWYLTRHADAEDLGYYMLVGVEESLEMTGVVVFIHALLEHIGGSLGGQPLRISVVARRQGSASRSR